MAIFEDVVLQWDGKEKTVPAHNVMRMLAKIEDHITLHEMGQFAERGTAPLIRVSMAYAAALKHAGFEVTDEGVYKRLVESSTGDEGRLAMQVVHSLQQMMIPPADLDVKRDPKAEKQGKPKAASNSSKRPTRRRSGSAG